jgi:hypothetical protein
MQSRCGTGEATLFCNSEEGFKLVQVHDFPPKSA